MIYANYSTITTPRINTSHRTALSMPSCDGAGGRHELRYLSERGVRRRRRMDGWVGESAVWGWYYRITPLQSIVV